MNTEQPPVRQLLVSIPGAIKAVRQKRVTALTLRTALVVFPCNRNHFFQPGDRGEKVPLVVFWTKLWHPWVYRLLEEEISRAESEGRVAWCNFLGDRWNWERTVNALFDAHGYPKMLKDPPSPEQQRQSPRNTAAGSYISGYTGLAYRGATYQGLRRRVEAARLPLEVIC